MSAAPNPAPGAPAAMVPVPQQNQQLIPPNFMAQMMALAQQQQGQAMPPLAGAVQLPVPVVGGPVPGVGGPVLGPGGQVPVPGGLVFGPAGQVVVPVPFVIQSRQRTEAVKSAVLNGNGKITLNESIKALIHNTVRHFIFRRVKFLTSAKQQTSYVQHVFEAMKMINFGGGLPEFQCTYGSFCVAQMNGQRNYVVDQVKKAVWDYMDSNAGDPPDYDVMKSFAKREIVWETATDDTKKLFVWYAGKLLTRVAGGTDWGKPKMCFEHISIAHFADNPNKKHIPAGTEAFLLLVLEGHCPVWKAQYDFRQDNDKDVEYPNIRFKRAEDIPVDHRKFVCKYTNPNGGGGRYGGWRETAWDKYIENKDELVIARQKPTVHLLEEGVMLALREKCNITQSTEAEYEAAKKKRKTANAVVPVERGGMMDEE